MAVRHTLLVPLTLLPTMVANMCLTLTILRGLMYERCVLVLHYQEDPYRHAPTSNAPSHTYAPPPRHGRGPLPCNTLFVSGLDPLIPEVEMARFFGR